VTFTKEAEDIPIHDMARMVDTSISVPLTALSTGAVFEGTRIQTAKSSRKG
jgi:hypothetical protein